MTFHTTIRVENATNSFIFRSKQNLLLTAFSERNRNMDIIYEDNKMLLINKEAGKLTQSAKSFEIDLTSEVLNYRRKKGEQAYAAVINRLDRPVSGLVLFAKDKTTAARLTTQMQQQGFCKQYYAVICGQLEQKSGTFVDYLLKNAKENMSRCSTDA